MDRTHRTRRPSRQGRGAWGAAVLFITWVLLWRRPGEVPTDIMILMFMLATACTQTLSGLLADRDAGRVGSELTQHGDRVRELGCPRIEQDPNVARAERIIEALHDMAESLKAVSRPDIGEARATAPPPRLVRSGDGYADGYPDRVGKGTGDVAAKFSVVDGEG
jgi:hypothetical protein